MVGNAFSSAPTPPAAVPVTGTQPDVLEQQMLLARALAGEEGDYSAIRSPWQGAGRGQVGG
jgi:hypothetical protein